MTTKAELLKKSLHTFYKTPKHLNAFLDVIEKRTKYSLRIIEWFCNNYSKKYNIILTSCNGKKINVYFAYQSHLNSYQKKQFDPFKRNHNGFEPFVFNYTKDHGVLTTVGQLNFFRWCISDNILEYVNKNIKEIKDDMNQSTNYISNKKSVLQGVKTVRKKRQPLSISATRTCIKYYSACTLEW